MPKKFPKSADTTYGLFQAKLAFKSEVDFEKWQSALLDFEADGTKAKLAKISKLWMGDYPRTSLFEDEELEQPLTVKKFLQFLKKQADTGEEFFEISQNQTSIDISAYLGSFESIENYTELLFLALIWASENKATGEGFLLPDNYYSDMSEFVAISMSSKTGTQLECSDLQNIDEDLAAKAEKIEPIIKEKYRKWLK